MMAAHLYLEEAEKYWGGRVTMQKEENQKKLWKHTSVGEHIV